jgi:hypothetical protein
MAREGQRATPATSKWTDINPVAAHDTVPTPSDLGISRDQSPEWQELAKVRVLSARLHEFWSRLR